MTENINLERGANNKRNQFGVGTFCGVKSFFGVISDVEKMLFAELSQCSFYSPHTSTQLANASLTPDSHAQVRNAYDQRKLTGLCFLVGH